MEVANKDEDIYQENKKKENHLFTSHHKKGGRGLLVVVLNRQLGGEASSRSTNMWFSAFCVHRLLTTEAPFAYNADI